MTRSIISRDKTPQAMGTYSQTVRIATVCLAGQILLVPETMKPVADDMDAVLVLSA